MNIQLQVCGLIITLFLLTIYRTQKRLGLVSDKIFSTMLVIVCACISLDIISVIAIHYADLIPELTLHIACKAYIISMIWVGWVNFIYIALDLNRTKKGYIRTITIMFFVTLIQSIIIALAPISVFDNGTDMYTYGPAVICTYIFTLFYIVSTLNMSIYIGKTKNRRRGSAVSIVQVLWILASVVQFFHNELLIVGFAMAVGTMVIYIIMENPDANLDRTLGCFNSYGYSSYLNSKFADSKRFSLLDITITGAEALKEKGINVEAISKQIIGKLMENDKLKLFKSFGTGVVVASEDDKSLDKVCEQINRAINKHSAHGNVRLVRLNDAGRFNELKELNMFMNYVKGTNRNESSSVLLVSDEMIKKYRSIQEVEQEIDLALKQDRVEAFLQPIYNAETGKVESAESLARIRQSDGSLLSPGLFIPVAESTGQINEIGERILEKVCEFLRDSAVIQLGIKTIHVNLSAVQCDNKNTAENLDRIVKKYGVNPKYISFEITETAVSSAKEILLENMNNLVEKGYSFALDDFGKGESNLMYIVETPIDIIKLDMLISKASFSNPKAKVIVTSVSDMASKLKLPIVAEGIESKNELDAMLSNGIRYIQGFYYSKPLPMIEFIEHLQLNRRVIEAKKREKKKPKLKTTRKTTKEKIEK